MPFQARSHVVQRVLAKIRLLLGADEERAKEAVEARLEVFSVAFPVLWVLSELAFVRFCVFAIARIAA